MSRDGSIEFDWADGTHRFRLAIGGLRELQEKTGVSPFVVYRRLIARESMVDDAPQVLRLGLIGGGLPPEKALALARRYAEERPPLESIPASIAVLGAALAGVPDEPTGKAEGPGGEPPPPAPTSD